MGSASMNTIMNNNRKLLPLRDRFKNRLGGYNSDKKTEYNLPKANAKQLKDISRRLKEEHKSRMLKIIVVTVILFLGLLLTFLYSSDGIIELLTY
ncbi:hypothetical protein [Winogradskyella haliclonae]|uniref:Riboflavin synthase subunit beta n=1 Tax=Winogradskyella haliclonae TaxID=2048558 RepID=A0ABQ2BW81_9FLAO|nr:hypothetical protein [Winogradskyella haliclonae]GGI56751.1 hypothetical protein GCM10011444_10600 [Winogradskyella haliclonae]